jgi:hypothetical protein
MVAPAYSLPAGYREVDHGADQGLYHVEIGGEDEVHRARHAFLSAATHEEEEHAQAPRRADPRGPRIARGLTFQILYIARLERVSRCVAPANLLSDPGVSPGAAASIP